MYFGNIAQKELQYFHGLQVPNFTIKLTDLLTSGLFKVETIVTGSIYRIYPLFYTGEISSSNPLDEILENKCIICKKETKETYITFISNPDEDVQDYVSYGTYFSIGDSLTTAQFNNIVDLLRTNTVHSDSFKLKQGLVNGDWADYTFDIDGTTITDQGILVTDETLTSLGTVILSNPLFHYTTYTLKLKVYHFTDINIGDTSADNIVVDTLSIVLEENQAVTIPFNTLDYSYVVGFDAVVEIKHDVPVIPDLPKHIYLSADKDIIQTGDKVDISATVKDIGGVTVEAGHDVYFYEAYEPTTIRLSSDKSIIQTNSKADITATVKDEDGSLIKDEDVYFYQQLDLKLTDNNGGLIELEDGSIKFSQNSGDNDSTLAYIDYKLDVVNKAYEVSFDAVDWMLNAPIQMPFRCCVNSVTTFANKGWIASLDSSEGWNLFDEITSYSSGDITRGDTVKIRLEDGNYILYVNDVEIASSNHTVGEPVYFGFRQWFGFYTTFKNLIFKEINGGE